ADKGIIKVSDLFRGSNRDIGLYIQLQRRKLLDSVSSDIRVNQETEALAGLVDALESFGGSNK
ncbi:MAG: hypothetical protein Q7S22_07100, partial [Candidatus Micrarchaeota archaeon]|nr:hypothetical protein [Candidatus Micrarchaeota archaeon]